MERSRASKVDIYIAPLQGLYPWTYVVVVNGKTYSTLVMRPGHPKFTMSQEADIIAGYREWFDHEQV